MSSRAKREAKMAAAMSSARSSPPPELTNKPSKVFGATVDFDGPDEIDKKLLRLRDMGFLDDQRNAMVLKGVNGSVDRAVETLIRMGEGGLTTGSTKSSSRDHALRASRSLTPLTKPAGTLLEPTMTPTGAPAERPTTASTTPASNNPFDMLHVPQPQTAHSTGSLRHNNPYEGGWGNASTNPFDGHFQRQPDAVLQAFQGLSVSGHPQQQNLFPHRTGDMGVPGHVQQPMPQQYMSPSAPSSLYYYQPPAPFPGSAVYPQPQQPVAGHSSNPFFPQQSMPAAAQAPSLSQSLSNGTGQMQAGLANNPFLRSPARIASPALGQIPEQGQSNFAAAAAAAVSSASTLQPQPTAFNPYYMADPTQPQPQPYYVGGQPAWAPQPASHHHHHYQQPPPPRHDNASILALFDKPYQSPSPQPQPSVASGAGLSTGPQAMMTTSDNSNTQAASSSSSSYSAQAAAHHSPSAQPAGTDPPRSVAQSLPGAAAAAAAAATNPFTRNGIVLGPEAGVPLRPSGVTTNRDSVKLGMDMAWTNGRHSPDAFASLSARDA